MFNDNVKKLVEKEFKTLYPSLVYAVVKEKRKYSEKRKLNLSNHKDILCMCIGYDSDLDENNVDLDVEEVLYIFKFNPVLNTVGEVKVIKGSEDAFFYFDTFYGLDSE